MKTKDQILLEDAYDKVNQPKLNALKGFIKNIDFDLRSFFWDAIAYVTEDSAAASLDQDYARSDDVLDWLATLNTNTSFKRKELKIFTELSLDSARETLQDEGIEWNPEIEQQFLDFFRRIIPYCDDSKVLEALSQRNVYTKEIDQILYR